MMPQQPAQSNVDYIMGLTRRVDELEKYQLMLQEIMSCMALMLVDDKGKVRINKQTRNRLEKLENIAWHTNSKNAIILDVVMKGDS